MLLFLLCELAKLYIETQKSGTYKKVTLKNYFVFDNFFRYKPVQKVDGVPDGFTGSGQQTGTSAEQTIIAQSQHHQQFLGMEAGFMLLYK